MDGFREQVKWSRRIWSDATLHSDQRVLDGSEVSQIMANTFRFPPPPLFN